ncbi:MAG: UDP-N-acetylmuramoyl-tripeptide--D-alanyl-D-alanine ligase [Bacteroidales bacterium]|nr:UDP-N-acetylmuramoyl-tripeptide--D-alanyl-D-alanine ligase [Bacteroidales bacterium]
MKYSIADIYTLFCQHPCISTDSRRCPKDSIFLALKGENFNGNRFAAASLEAGCAYAIVDEAEFANNERIILVDNCLKTLQDLAHHHRMQFKDLPVIGITGTNGKTTTKELSAAVLAKKFNVLYTQGNLNNHIGVPLTLLQLRPEHNLAIIEMGANHPGEIAELVEIVHPTHGLITNVGKAHLEGFGSFQGVIDTKTALYRFLQKEQGLVFYNPDNEILSAHAQAGLSQAYIAAKCLAGSHYLHMTWQGEAGEHLLETQLIGAYNAENVRAAISLGLHFGVEETAINEAIQEYRPSNKRSQWMESAHNQLIVDAYNANPSSMNAALDNFLPRPADKKKAVILGAMRELGVYSQEEHERIIKRLLASDLESILLIGEEFGHVNDARVRQFQDSDNCRKALETDPLQGYCILIKGSRSNQLEKLIDLL